MTHLLLLLHILLSIRETLSTLPMINPNKHFTFFPFQYPLGPLHIFISFQSNPHKSYPPIHLLPISLSV